MRVTYARTPALALCALVALFAAGTAGAETTPIPAAAGTAIAASPAAAAAGAGPVTLEKARSLALAASSTLQRALLDVDAARLTEKTQSYSVLPSLSASAGAALDYPTGSKALIDGLTTSVGLSATATLYDGGKSAILSAIDSIATDIARASARSTYFTVLEDCDDAFYGVLESAASVQAARDALDAARAHQDLAQARFDVGIITRGDLLEIQAETASDESALATALKDLAVAKAKLASLTGLSTGAALEGVDETYYDALMARFAGLSDTQVDGLAAKLVAIAEKNSPSLAQARLASGKAQRSVDAARADYLPSVATSWSQSLSYGRSAGSLAGSLAGSGSLGLTATIPLDWWTTKTAVDSAAVAARQAGLDLAETGRGLDLDLRSAVYDCIALAQAFASSSKAQSYAQSHYDGVLEQYKLSSASSSDLSDAEALLSSDKTLLIKARYEFLVGLSSLRSLVASESDDLIVTAIP